MTPDQKIEMLRRLAADAAQVLRHGQMNFSALTTGDLVKALDAALAATAETSAPNARHAELLAAMEEAWDAGYNECALMLKGCAGMGRDWKLRNMLAELLEAK